MDNLPDVFTMKEQYVLKYWLVGLGSIYDPQVIPDILADMSPEEIRFLKSACEKTLKHIYKKLENSTHG